MNGFFGFRFPRSFGGVASLLVAIIFFICVLVPKFSLVAVVLANLKSHIEWSKPINKKRLNLYSCEPKSFVVELTSKRIMNRKQIVWDLYYLVEILRPSSGDRSVHPPDFHLPGGTVVKHLSAVTSQNFRFRFLVFGRWRFREIRNSDDDRSGSVFEVRMIAQIVHRLLAEVQIFGPEIKTVN
jgi:hypothetical protein